MRVSAVVVNYNAGGHLLDCVRSLKADGVDEIVVVDNASTDGSTEAVTRAEPAVIVHTTGGNLGFGAGANRGAAVASGGRPARLKPRHGGGPGGGEGRLRAARPGPG